MNEERLTEAAEWADGFDQDAFMRNVFNKRFCAMSVECFTLSERESLAALSSLFAV